MWLHEGKVSFENLSEVSPCICLPLHLIMDVQHEDCNLDSSVGRTLYYLKKAK